MVGGVVVVLAGALLDLDQRVREDLDQAVDGAHLSIKRHSSYVAHEALQGLVAPHALQLPLELFRLLLLFTPQLRHRTA